MNRNNRKIGISVPTTKKYTIPESGVSIANNNIIRNVNQNSIRPLLRNKQNETISEYFITDLSQGPQTVVSKFNHFLVFANGIKPRSKLLIAGPNIFPHSNINITDTTVEGVNLQEITNLIIPENNYAIITFPETVSDPDGYIVIKIG